MSYMLNKFILLNKKPNKHLKFTITIIILIIVFLIYCIKNYTYDSYQTTGIVKCEKECFINITLPYDKVDILSKDPIIKYNNNIYEIKSINYKEPYLDKEIAYQDIELVSFVKEEKIINFNILYNKQRIISKIKNIIVERKRT